MEHIYYDGGRKRIVWAQDGHRFRGREYVAELEKGKRAKVEALLERMADHGEIRNKEKFRSEGDGLYCFKSFQQRLLCFFDGRDIVITHGLTKKKDAMQRTELERAKRIRDGYMRGKGQKR